MSLKEAHKMNDSGLNSNPELGTDRASAFK